MIKQLEEYTERLRKVAIAYSGGVDSTFLLATSARVLGERRVVALTIESPLTPAWEVDFAKEFCNTRGIKHVLLDGSFILDDERFASNPPERCYFCKKQILATVKNATPRAHALLTATNASDESDFRPGMKAEEEMEISTPLRDLRFTKDDIRRYSKIYHIPAYNRPPCACFASRIPHGDPITLNKLRMIKEAETFLRNLGFELVRVRMIAKETACVEVVQDRIRGLFQRHEEISRHLSRIGFRRVTLDLEGYRQGKLSLESNR